MSTPLPDTRTILTNLSTWYSRLPVQSAAPLTGATREADALLHGWRPYDDETLFLYGYTVGALEHCFFYDTPWDERGRVPGRSPAEWYDGLSMPRPFRVRYSVARPDQHEILDPLLREMMKRTLHRVGTRPTVPRPLTAGAEEVLAHIDRWHERLPLLRRQRYLPTSTPAERVDWRATTARFGQVVGTGDAAYLSYAFEVDGTRFVFAVKVAHPLSRMTPNDHAPDTPRAERRAHLAEARRQENGLLALAGAPDVPVRFHPEDPGALHVLEPSARQPGESPLVLDPYTTVYQLEPVVFPPSLGGK